MADHEFAIDASFVHPLTKQTVEYKMKTSIWLTDQQLMNKCLKPDGNLNVPELWIARLAECVHNLTDAEIRKLDQYTMNYLIAKWLEYNDPNSSFLVPPMIQDESLTKSTS